METQPEPVASALIVDDEDSVRHFVQRCLDDAAFTFADANSGPSALEIASKRPAFDLLITDEMMPEMEGHELARQLRTQYPDLKVLYLTGYADHLFDEKSQLWALEAYLSKPFSRAALREAVAHLLFGRMTL